MKVSFYCKDCKLDQDMEAEMGYYSGGGRKFVAGCVRCGRQLFRLIDDKKNDPYYFLSKNVIINRRKFVKDLIQPGDVGFQTYYKKEYDKIKKAEENYYKKQESEKKSRDEFYKNTLDKNLAKKVLDKEDEIKYGFQG